MIALQYYQVLAHTKKPPGMFYYSLPSIIGQTNNTFLYFVPNCYPPSFPGRNYSLLLQTATPQPNISPSTNQSNFAPPNFTKQHHSIFFKTETSEEPEKVFENHPQEKMHTQAAKDLFKKSQSLRSMEIKLDFRIEWNNEYRNIVPNLVNQMMSFLFKKSKSQRLINRLFSLYPHSDRWTPDKFYQYMKKIRESVCHYVNESIIKYFFEIHEPKFEIYSEDQQEFYMKLCRIAILHFLRSEAATVSLTSSRMSKCRRAAHLVAREAILKKFLELARC